MNEEMENEKPLYLIFRLRKYSAFCSICRRTILYTNSIIKNANSKTLNIVSNAINVLLTMTIEIELTELGKVGALVGLFVS